MQIFVLEKKDYKIRCCNFSLSFRL